MSATDRAGRIWAWAAGGAGVVVALVLLLFSLVKPPGPAPAGEPVRPAIGFAKPASGSALKDEQTLLDPTPLFLPTEWNAAHQKVAWREPGGEFQSYRITPKLGFAETDLKLELPAPVALPAGPAAVLVDEAPGALLLGFGRTERPVPALPARGAVVKVVLARTGQPALSPEAQLQVATLAAAARPPEPASGLQWQPVEFLAAVDAAGLVGPPVIVEPRSGVEEVDSYFQNFLVQTLRLGERLGPGFYRISVGP